MGQRIGTTLPTGDELSYQFDENQHFIGLSHNQGSLLQRGLNTSGQEYLRSFANNLQTQSHYDPQGRLIQQTTQQQGQVHATVSHRRYHYNAQGQLSQIEDFRKGNTHYHYDPLDRLTQVEGPHPEQFVFDPANNLLAINDDDNATTTEQAESNTEQAKGNRLAFQGDVHYRYDAHGNRCESARGKAQQLKTAYTYNAQNQLIAIDKEGNTTRFEYDALGRRTQKTTATHETTFYWDGDVLLSEHTKTISHGPEEHDNYTNERLYLHEPGTFKPVALIDNNGTYYYHLDHLGTPQEMTDEYGNIAWSASYKAYGNLAIKHVNHIEQPIRFQGQYFDEETGLHYNRHRYYDPSCGQFITQDPIGLLGGTNNYQYVPNPTGWVDPYGLTSSEIDDICPKGERRQRHHSSSAEYPKHVKARSQEDAIKISSDGGASQYWDDTLPSGATQPQVNAARNRMEKEALANGVRIPQAGKGSDYYVYDAGRTVGYNNGKPTSFMRVEATKGMNSEFHGHPITQADYNAYIKTLSK